MKDTEMYREVEGSFEGVACTYVEKNVGGRNNRSYVPVAIKLSGEFLATFAADMLDKDGEVMCSRKVYVGNGAVSLWEKLDCVASCEADMAHLPKEAMDAWKERGEVLSPFHTGRQD